MLAGLVAGLLAFGFARAVGEPAVSVAISFEEQRAAAAGTPYQAAIVSRDVQSTLGLLTAVVVAGVALGGLFAIAFAAAYGRVRHASPARTAIWLGAGAFVVVFLVPFLKYPANPPAVGRPETIGTRTALYVAMLAISLLSAAYALWLDRRLRPRLGDGGAALAAAGAYLALVVAGGLLLPGVNEVPDGFPATALWNFRVAAAGIQAITWSTTALTFAFLATSVLKRYD
jgi:Probable cobalt transporter subunit (CbtA)